MLEGPPAVPPALLDEIEAAFPRAAPPPAVVDQPAHCSGCRSLTAVLRGQPWREVPPRDLDATVDANAMLTPEAFAYYVPAYIRRSVERFCEPGLGVTDAVTFVVQSLADPRLTDDPWWHERATKFSSAQHRVIASYLSWVVSVIGDDQDESWLAACAHNALERFWAKAPTSPAPPDRPAP